jgi:hypothetical protein
LRSIKRLAEVFTAIRHLDRTISDRKSSYSFLTMC